MDQQNIDDVVRELRVTIRNELGKRASEDEIRTFLDDGILDDYRDNLVCSEEELEEAVETVIADYFETTR